MKYSAMFLALVAAGSISSANAACASFAPYHLMTLNMQSGQPMNLVSVSQATGVKNFTLAFIINSGGGCNPAWDGEFATSSAWGKSLTDSMRAAGIAYNISFGGASGNDISAACSVTQLVNAYRNIITTYQPNGLDFDIENGTANVANVMSALKTIHASFPNVKLSFTVPVMPDGLDSTAKSIVTQAKNAGLTFSVNIMTMDYSSSHTGDMGQYAISALNATHVYLRSLYPEKTAAQVWAMLAPTSMIGVNDIVQEKFTLQDATELTAFANQNGLAWISMWSLDRDHPCSTTSPAREDCSGANLQTSDYQYSKIFNQCTPTPPPGPTCLPPANIRYTVATNKRSVTFTWDAPSGSAPIVNYQVDDWQHAKMWTGTTRTFSDTTLPGTAGTFEYFFSSNCQSSKSTATEVVVKIR